MAYITGSGNLTFESLESDSDLGYRSKEVIGTGALVAEEAETWATGLGFEDGEILGYPTWLEFEPVTFSGTGKRNNLYGIPIININANFQVDPISITARFPL